MRIFKKTQTLALVFLFVVFAVSPSPARVFADSKSTLIGPNIDELVFSIEPRYRLGLEIASLRAGQVDMVPSIWDSASFANVSADPNVKLYKSPGGSTRMAFLVFNTRRNPFDNVEFRRAISLFVDRQYFGTSALAGWAEPLETFVPDISNQWVNHNATAPKFDPHAALDIFRDLGYTVNRTFNRTTLTMVDSKTGEPLREFTLLSPELWEAGGLWTTANYTAGLLNRLVGIKVRHVALPEPELLARIVDQRDFDMCVYDVDLGDLPFGLYGFLHSSFDKPGTFAYSGIHDAALDKALENLWFGITRSEMLKGAYDAQARLAALVPYVPIYSTYNIAAVSPEWEGLANMTGYGVVNRYTYMGIHKAGRDFGGRFVQSLEGEMASLNPLVANQSQEYYVLDLLYSPLLALDPVTWNDMPVLATQWQTEPWQTATGNLGMKITFKLNNSTVWQDGEPFTAEDVKFCIEYLQASNIPQFEYVWNNLVKVDAPDRTTVQIYLNATGYRYIYEYAGMTFLPEHIWKDVKDYKTFKPWQEPHPTIKGLTKLIGQGPFIFLQADLSSYVELVWNPLFLWKNPMKPNLIERQPANLTASSGEPINIQYKILNYTRGPITDATASLAVRKDNNTLLVVPVTYANGFYSAQVDTGKIGPGQYTCEFDAPPYGLDTFTITVSQPTAPIEQPSSFTFLAAGVVAIIAVAAIVLVMRRRIRRHPVNSDMK